MLPNGHILGWGLASEDWAALAHGPPVRFGAFEHNGHKIFWKIDYYDRTSFGTGHDMGSEDPSDPAKTLRVLTIMLAGEY